MCPWQINVMILDWTKIRRIFKGSVDAMKKYMREQDGIFPDRVEMDCVSIANDGGTPLVVVENDRVMGVIHLKDIVKGGIKERFEELRHMGIKTIMITGDNRLTAAAIAAEAQAKLEAERDRIITNSAVI